MAARSHRPPKSGTESEEGEKNFKKAPEQGTSHSRNSRAHFMSGGTGLAPGQQEGRLCGEALRVSHAHSSTSP